LRRDAPIYPLPLILYGGKNPFLKRTPFGQKWANIGFKNNFWKKFPKGKKINEREDFFQREFLKWGKFGDK